LSSTTGEQSREVRNFQGESIEVIYRTAKPIEESAGLHDVLAPGTTVKDGMCYERDVAVVLRDGTTIYTDVHAVHRSDRHSGAR
jgi:predicted acyl esterase